MKKQLKELILKNFGKNPTKGYSYYNAENRMDDVKRFHKAIAKDNMIDDITWDDLEMDRVFLTINHTNSFIGEQVLFHKLHILDRGMISRERVITYYDENPDERMEAEAQLSYIGKHKEAYHLVQFLLNTDIWNLGNIYIFHILQLVLLITIIGTVIFHSALWIAGLVVSALVNLFLYTTKKTKYEIFFNSLSDFKAVYDTAKWMEHRYADKDIYETADVKEALRNLRKLSIIILGMKRRRKNAMSGDVIALLLEYVWGIFLLDLSMFNYLMRIIKQNISAVFTILYFIGDIDADIAVLSYRKSISEWCRPEFVDDGIEIEGVVHPLIDSAVSNNFSLDKRAMITGANASGKSTFMKSVAINSILAQTINTCTARSMKMKPVHVITCMSLRDDVVTGESYYFREAKYLKRMLDIIVENSEVLIVIDEILKGTNTGERIAASRAVLDYISETECMALVATHDKELTDNKCYDNYYFTSKVDGSDIRFDYLIHSGTTVDTNAIDLLYCLDYPSVIVDNAKEYMNAYKNNNVR